MNPRCEQCGSEVNAPVGAAGEGVRLTCPTCGASLACVVPLDYDPAGTLAGFALPKPIEPPVSLATGFETSFFVGKGREALPVGSTAPAPPAATSPTFLASDDEAPPFEDAPIARGGGTEHLEAGSLASPPASAPTGAWLMVVGAAAGKERVELVSARTVFGREGADVVFDDPALSGRHFQIDVVGRELFIRDLGSSNGTLVNGSKVRYAELLPGDEISAGQTVLVCRSVSDRISGRPTAAAPPAAAAPGNDDEASTSVRRTRARTQSEMAEELRRMMGSGGPQPTEAAGSTASTQGGAPPPPLSDELMGTRISAAAARDSEEPHRDPGELRLVLPSTQGENDVVLRKRRNVIGRGFVDIGIRDPLASLRHAEITIEAGGIYILKDLATTNGTKLNGRRITVARLSSGDRIEIGDTVLRFIAAPRGSFSGR